MTPKGKKALLVIGSIVAIGGVVGYILWKRKKDKEGQTSTGTGTGTDTGTQAETPLMSSSYTTPSGGGGSTQYTFPFTTTEEGNKFRAWVIAKDPAFAKSISLDAKGGLNSFLQKAWEKYGSEYQKGSTTTTSGEPLDQVQSNLGTGVIPVERYTDKVIARIILNNQGYAGSFYKNGNYFLFGKGGAIIKKGTWSDGGRKIVLSNGRIISSGSVWNNVRATVTA